MGMGTQLEFRCYSIACFLFVVVILLRVSGSRGTGIAQGPQVSSAAPFSGQQPAGPSHDGTFSTANVPSTAPISKGGALPPIFPPKPVPIAPTIQTISPSMPDGSPPPLEQERSKANPPSIESFSQLPPAMSGKGHVSPPNSLPSPLSMPPTIIEAPNGTSSSNNTPMSIPVAPVSSRPLEIPSNPPVEHPRISGLPPLPLSVPNVKDLPGPAPPPMFSISPVRKSDHVPAAAPSVAVSSNHSGFHPYPLREFVPVSSPKSHEPISSTLAPAPLVSHSQPPKGRKNQAPAPAPMIKNQNRGAKRDYNNSSSSPLSNQAPLVSPLPSVAVPMTQKFHNPPPVMQGPSPSMTMLASPPEPLHKAPSSQSQGYGPIISPTSSFQSSPVASYNQAHGPSHSPMVSPSGSLHIGSGSPLLSPATAFPPSPLAIPQPKKSLPPSPSPVPQPRHALPPPPNPDCSLLVCMDPLTNSPSGSPCGCVLPIKVELRLSIALYPFFPLVSELAQEIASGTFLKQRQVHIMGANAADQPNKSIVLVYLVPLGEYIEQTTALLISKRFWNKQVGIKASYFGDYDVLYVKYPGLPPSPPMSPENINVDDGPFGNENNSRRIHPIGVDIRKSKEKLSGSLIAVIVLSSVIALVLSVGAAWFLFLKLTGGDSLYANTPRALLPLFSKVSGTGPTVLGGRPSSASGSFSSSMATYTGSAKTFTAAELERATNKFEESRIIGEGGFGRVYLGILEDESKVAVKVLKRDDHQGSREFLAEVEMLGRLHHRNLVKLIGICTEDHLRCLVYELIPNGSVESHLHGVDKDIAPLDWGARMKIAFGSARGLAYLHEDSSPRVIHRDFKSSNILLEGDFTPKVSDFGLARTALEEGNEHISTRVMGTFGYVAPEYAMTGHLLVKSDVYSYGVVLLELLTGRKPVDMSRPPGQENLVNWARPLLTSREGLQTIIDPALCSSFPFDNVAKVAAIASMCVQPEVSHRPFMGEVVQALKLVCDENDDHRASGSCSQGDASEQDPEMRISTRFVPEADRVLSASEIFNTSATLTREVSGSFRRHSSSGPLWPSRGGQFWQRLRGFSRGSTSDHGIALGSTGGRERWP